MKRSIAVTGIFLIIQAMTLTGQDIPDAPVPPRLVNDLADILSPGEEASLESKLVAFNDTASTQIAVVTVKSLNGYTREEFADQLGEKWGVGRKGKDNGVLILVKPKYSNEKGEVRISIGYGLEAVIPDALCTRIVEYDMKPHFKEGDYYTGIDKATTTVMSLAAGEFTAEEYEKKTTPGLMGILIPIIIITLILIFISRKSGRHYNSGSKPHNFWTALWLAGMLNSGRGGSGSWGDFNSGGGGFGGGGGGGFGGFGGGSFGGGGAGGSW